MNKYVKKRYQICIDPIEGLNGKLAQSSAVVHNSTVKESAVQYYYGIRRGNSKPGFALRKFANTTAATAAQTAVRTKFATAVANTATILADPDQLAAQIAAWKANPEGYTSVRTYTFAQEFAK